MRIESVAGGGSALRGYFKFTVSAPFKLNKAVITPNTLKPLEMMTESPEISVNIDPTLYGTVKWTVDEKDIVGIVDPADPDDPVDELSCEIFEGESVPILLKGGCGGIGNVVG